MIRVTVELISAIDGHTETLGIAEIWNDATGNETTGNYKFKLGRRGQKYLGKTFTGWREGKVKDFPRKRLLVWDLLYRCLKEAVEDRNEERSQITKNSTKTNQREQG